MNSTEIGRHLGDADLVRYLDDDAATEESRRWQRHLNDCPRCTGAMETLRKESRLVSDWLGRAEFEAGGAAGVAGPRRSGASSRPRIPPASWRRRTLAPWLRAAALLVLLAAPLAAFPGIRAWVVERVAGPVAEMGEETRAVAAAAEPTVLRFVPAPGEFTVRFEPGSRGAITIDRSGDAEAVLEAAGGEPDAFVSASMLRIRNPDAARYHLQLPDATTGIWIMVGERAVAVSDSQIDRRAVVELERR